MDVTTHPLLKRLMLRSVHDQETGCFLWTGKLAKGYGQIRYEGRYVRLHRIAYEVMVGPCPEGLEPDHTCRRPACWNPEHLDWVTHRENTLRGTSPAAMNARKTHCPVGHEYTPENTRVRASRPNQRECKKCRKRYERLRLKRQMAELKELRARLAPQG